MKSFARFFGIGSEKAEALDHKPEEVVENCLEGEKESVDGESLQGEDLMRDPSKDVTQIKVTEIIANPFQPRKTFHAEALQDLADSIREFGVIQPLLVRRINDGFELVAGERRLRASKLAGLEEVPAIIKDLTDKEMAELAMIENLQREDLHFLEEAEGFQQLLQNFGFTQEVLAKRMGKSQSTIANKLRLLKLDEGLRQRIFEAQLTERHARALLKLSDAEKQKEALEVIIERGFNVRESEVFIQEMNQEEPQDGKKTPRRNVVRVIRDVRIFLNTINSVAKEMKKSGLKVKVDQEQDEEYITVKMVIPKKKDS